MTIHLPEELQRFIQAEVSLGHFASEEEATTQAGTGAPSPGQAFG